MTKRHRAPPDAERRLLALAVDHAFAWQLALAAWRTRYGMDDAEIRARAVRVALWNNPWQPRPRSWRRRAA